jgi:hypothetical protein
MPGFKHALNQLNAHHGWVGLPPRGTPVPLSLGAGPLDNSLTHVMGKLSQRADTSPGTSLQNFLNWLSENLPDDTAQQIADQFATSITSGRTNVANGEKETIGTLGIDLGTGQRPAIGKTGTGVKLSYDDAGALVPGTTLPGVKVLDFLGITRKFKFNGIKDVQVALIFDQDALRAEKYGLMFSGVSVKKPVKVRGAADATLTITAGRDQAGGPAFSFSLSYAF